MLIELPDETDGQNAVDKIRRSVCGEMMISHHLLGASPAARPYLHECAERYSELEDVSNEVEIGICTCTWVNS